jgi:hypothetical protein
MRYKFALFPAKKCLQAPDIYGDGSGDLLVQVNPLL